MVEAEWSDEEPDAYEVENYCEYGYDFLFSLFRIITAAKATTAMSTLTSIVITMFGLSF